MKAATKPKREHAKCRTANCQKFAQKGGHCKAHGGGKRCVQPGCDKSAQGSTHLCKAHGGGKRCGQPGCDKSAQGATDLCKAHGGGKRCVEPGCDKSAQGATDLCRAHGGGKRCSSAGCTKSAQGATDLCRAHGGGKRCVQPGCTKGAEGKTDFCKAHGGGKRCVETGCNKSAIGTTGFCKAHGGGKRCVQPGCDKSALSPTDFCMAHGGGNRCTVCNLVGVNRKGFVCYSCRVGTARFKQFEAMVEEFLQTDELLAMYSYRDQALPCSPNRKRGDFVYMPDEDRIVVLEVDEHCHRYYERSCEVSRILELHEQGRGRALFLIRFNPLQRLLPPLKELLYRCFVAPLPDNLLDVQFLGYPTALEYDVVEEVTNLAQEQFCLPCGA